MRTERLSGRKYFLANEKVVGGETLLQDGIDYFADRLGEKLYHGFMTAFKIALVPGLLYLGWYTRGVFDKINEKPYTPKSLIIDNRGRNLDGKIQLQLQFDSIQDFNDCKARNGERFK